MAESTTDRYGWGVVGRADGGGDGSDGEPSEPLRSRDGVRPLLANAITMIGDTPGPWDGVLGYDTFSDQVVLLAPPPWSETSPADWRRQVWGDYEDLRAAEWLQRMEVPVSPGVALEAVQVVARRRSFNPLVDWLEGLSWDGRSRLDTWLTYYLGVDDTTFARAAGAKWMISGIARAMQPGCKVDHMLVLEGPQDLGKSTALRILSNEWFTDEIGTPGDKDTAMQIAGVWIVEVPELDTIRRTDVETVKAFLTRTFDRFRPPYGRHVRQVERQCIFAGTVNHGSYLRDETGARRFWPVRCTAIDLEGLAADRDQLWAEAVVRWRKGETWWMDTTELREAAVRAQADRYAGDPWEDLVDARLTMRTQVTVGELLEEVLGIPTFQRSQAHQTRVAKILRTRGWRRTRGQAVAGGRRPWIYVPPDRPAAGEREDV